MSYRAYWRVTEADNGRSLGKRGLEPVAENINARLRAEPYFWGRVWVTTHYGKASLRMDARTASEARVIVRTTQAFLRATGWRWTEQTTRATHRALMASREGLA